MCINTKCILSDAAETGLYIIVKVCVKLPKMWVMICIKKDKFFSSVYIIYNLVYVCGRRHVSNS